MDEIDISKYEIKEMIHQPEDENSNDLINYLLRILNDRSIPEDQKHLVRKQFDEVMRLKNITMKPPTIVISPKK